VIASVVSSVSGQDDVAAVPVMFMVDLCLRY